MQDSRRTAFWDPRHARRSSLWANMMASSTAHAVLLLDPTPQVRYLRIVHRVKEDGDWRKVGQPGLASVRGLVTKGIILAPQTGPLKGLTRSPRRLGYGSGSSGSRTAVHPSFQAVVLQRARLPLKAPSG